MFIHIHSTFRARKINDSGLKILVKSCRIATGLRLKKAEIVMLRMVGGTRCGEVYFGVHACFAEGAGVMCVQLSGSQRRFQEFYVGAGEHRP